MVEETDWIKEHEKYLKKQREYLLNKKPERYKLQVLGWDGFIILDTLRYKHNYDKEGYMLMPSYTHTDEKFRVDKKFYNPQELVDELNKLDFQVNSNLYDDYYHILSNKERIYSYINNRLDSLLDNVGINDSFKITLNDYPSNEALTIEVKVYKEEFIAETSPFLDNIIIRNIFQTINNYLDETENKDNHDDMIRTDTLIELKMRLLETLQRLEIPLL